MRWRNHISLLGLVIWAILSPASAYAVRVKGLKRPLPGGIVFPAFADGVRVNPSYLAEEKARVFQAAYSPPSSYVPDQHDIGLSLASADKGFGWGIDYRTVLDEDERPVYGLSIAAGVKADIFSFGLGLNAEDISDGFLPDISLSLRGKDGKMYYQGIFNKLNSSSQLDLGAGISDDKSYSLELNVSLPPFEEWQPGSGGDNNYRISAAVAVYDRIFGASAITSFDTSTFEHSHRFNLMVHPVDWLYINTEVAFPLRYRLAITLNF